MSLGISGIKAFSKNLASPWILGCYNAGIIPGTRGDLEDILDFPRLRGEGEDLSIYISSQSCGIQGDKAL